MYKITFKKGVKVSSTKIYASDVEGALKAFYGMYGNAWDIRNITKLTK